MVFSRATLLFHRATHAGDATELSDTTDVDGVVVAPESKGVEARSQAMAPPQHPPPPKSKPQKADADVQQPLAPSEPLEDALHGILAPPRETASVPSGRDVAAQPGLDAPNGTVTSEAKTTGKSPNVQIAERLGMYQEPSSSFPACLPSDSADAVGPSPNLIIDTDGLQRRVPNSAIDLIEEMEEADLKNPSSALLVCFSSAPLNRVPLSRCTTP